MKKFVFISFFLVSFNFLSIAQISYGGFPRSLEFSDKSNARLNNEINKITIETPSDSIRNFYQSHRNLAPFYKISINVDFFKECTSIQLEDRSFIHRLEMEAKNAKSITLYFSKFSIGLKEKLFVYNSEATIIRGAFTHQSVRSNGKFLVSETNGSSIIIELNTPRKKIKSTQLNIEAIDYEFDDLNYPPAEITNSSLQR